MTKQELRFFDRELSWLSFNYRVLQEAKDPSVPLYERIKFIAIWSSNLDEFFRVRVASLRSLLNFYKIKKKSDIDPSTLLKQTHKEVEAQQEEFGGIFRENILKNLAEENIYLITENDLDEQQKNFVSDYFDNTVIPHIQPLLLVKKKIIPFLQNQRLYLAVKLAPISSAESERTRHTYSLVEIPDDRISRFVMLPEKDGKFYIMFLDDIIRFNLNKIFQDFEVKEVGSVKLTRDAELYIEDEFNGDLLQKIQKSLSKRKTGVPSRFLYDNSISKDFKKFLREALNLSKEDMIPGGRYHNFNDFFGFPNPKKDSLQYSPMPPLKNKLFDREPDKFKLIKERDLSLVYPYESYDHLIDFFNQASKDPAVKSIKVTQYRVASDSAIIKSLIEAKKNGKEVMVFVEVKARFDEEQNIEWAKEMENAGVKVYYSFPGLKVHAKIALVTRVENDSLNKYAYLATGNFNEKTAKIYSDFGLFTSNLVITNEVSKVFRFISRKQIKHDFKHLLVAQFNIRRCFNSLIDNEISNAKKGRDAWMIIKLNSLEDKKMIKKLYKASQAGVQINIICRGICCLIPGVKGLSENINVTSIVDRFLEHARFFIFHNDGDEKIYAASADWMKRNLSRRIEVGFPIYDNEIKNKIKNIVELQLKDNVKGRIIDVDDKNKYKQRTGEQIRSQYAIYDYLKSLD